jgi:hypothetical protein
MLIQALILASSYIYISFFFNFCGGTLGSATTYWPFVPAPDDR